MKKVFVNVVFLLSLGLLINGLELVVFKKVCAYPEYGPDYYGFPLIYRTNMSWVNTGSGIVFVSNWLLNTVFWIVVSTGIWEALHKLMKLKRGIPMGIKAVIILLSVGYHILSYNALHLRFEWLHDVKMDYYQEEIDCESELHFLFLDH